MMGHKICFYGEMWLIIPELSLLLPLIWSSVGPFHMLSCHNIGQLFTIRRLLSDILSVVCKGLMKIRYFFSYKMGVSPVLNDNKYCN